jgi:hypothetical protein
MFVLFSLVNVLGFFQLKSTDRPVPFKSRNVIQGLFILFFKTFKVFSQLFEVLLSRDFQKSPGERVHQRRVAAGACVRPQSAGLRVAEIRVVICIPVRALYR